MTFGIRWIPKGGSQFADTSTAMADQGLPAAASLGEVHMLSWDTVPARGRWPAVDESEIITELMQGKMVKNSTQ